MKVVSDLVLAGLRTREEWNYFEVYELCWFVLE